ncbi:hypothetical protein [Aliarcobacter skirrowii]|uniref:Uncharacterized protein n=1 Tax=Aliarcobacter skirrowii CCUG 10374 TaxID=1032239 RepID=A0AAD0WNB6_9BACT|nr:hypothetical protein [Aliarcobacter skirrowii]AXX84732.1 hypothetical protein ASKIR_0915 [Aliarcobacter skirrowii CCUG 10374]KAB0620277.1 hypothetical protein F7P70_08490 [Aliarcobacter skirrowii CCUG 10374]RXI25460.1 hypothetical protein CP959_08520 [Aliarcobacter skirrowii CCUG 10374]SUV14905.1 Uncharacterised protein [Aliarcobacter skirrowii]
MPQLIAMIIIVVGAMIYMFQTFGGTGDKITGVAQKTSVITEINNIKSGLKFAARDGKIANDYSTANPVEYYNTLVGLARDGYFAEQINEQIARDKDGNARTGNTFNQYSAISFGGNATNNTDGSGSMLISLIANTPGTIPGIFVDLSRGTLEDNAGFLESQIETDLKGIAYVDRKASVATAGATFEAGAKRTTGTAAEQRLPIEATTGTNDDGMFAIYFYDFGPSELVLSK